MSDPTPARERELLIEKALGMFDQATTRGDFTNRVRRNLQDVLERLAALATPPAQPMREREAFEAWARPLGFRLKWADADELGSEGYEAPSTAHAFAAWVARASLTEPKDKP